MKRIFLLVVILLFALSGIQSCQKFQLNTEDLDLELAVNIIKTNLTLLFMTSEFPEPGQSGDIPEITVEIVGEAKNFVVDPSGKRYEKYRSVDGFVVLSLDPYRVKPTADKPLNLVIIAKAPGYLEKAFPIEIAEEGDFEFIVPMIDMDNPPKGTTIIDMPQISTINSAGLVSPIDIQTPGNEFHLTIAEGASLIDQNNTPLQGPVHARIVYIQPSEAKSRRACNEVDIWQVKTGGGELLTTPISPAILFKVSLTDDEGRIADRIINGKASMDIQIDQDAINEFTNEKFAIGDTLAHLGFDQTIGTWVKYAEFVYGEPGRLKVDPAFLAVYNEMLRTIAAMQNNWDQIMRNAWNVTHPYVQLKFLPPDKLRDPDKKPFDFIIELSYRMYRVTGKPTNPNGTTIEIRPSWFDELTIRNTNQCGITFWLNPGFFTENWQDYERTLYTITLQPQTFETMVNVSVRVVCDDTGVQFIPQSTLLGRYRNRTWNCWHYANVVNGSVSVPLPAKGILGKEIYELQVLYDQEWVPEPAYYVIDPGSSVTLEAHINCNQ